MFKWYVLQVFSGLEKKVVGEIWEAAEKKGLTPSLKEIFIPLEKTVQTGRMGKKTVQEKNSFPGYVLVCCDLNDMLHSMILNVERVTGFLKANGNPVVVSESEIKTIKKRSEENLAQEIKDEFTIGEVVSIEHGAFAGIYGTIREILPDQKMKVEVMIFGRSVMVDLVEKDIKKKVVKE